MTTDLHDLAAAYALDALDADERIAFEAHLADCDQCPGDVAEFRTVAEGLADATAQYPPPNLRAAVLSQLSGIEQDRPDSEQDRSDAHDGGPVLSPATRGDAPVVDLAARRRRRFSMPAVLSAAAAVALIAVSAVVISGLRGGGSDYDAVVAAPDARVVELVGDSGSVEVVWSPALDQVALRGDGLLDLGPELRYALWAITDGAAIPAGLFDAEDGTIREVSAVDVSPQAWGITIEPASGSDAPTSDIIYFAEV